MTTTEPQEGQQEPAQEAEPKPPPKPQPTPAESAPAADHDSDLEGIRTAQTVYTTINGNVTADSAVFGISPGGDTSRRATGPIGQREVQAALRWFVPPDNLERARGILDQHHLLVLFGAEGNGKRAAALKLLSDLDAPELTSVSPAASLPQLTKLTFSARGGYLVRDHVSDGSLAQVRAYDAQLLEDKLKQADAYLVITTTEAALSPRNLPEIAVELHPPSMSAVLDRCLEPTPLDSVLRDRARDYVSQLRCPRDVVALCRRLKDDPARAFEALQSTARDQVTAWANNRPTKKDVFTVTTLALVGSQPEPTLDVLLEMVLDHAKPAPDQREPVPYVEPHNEFMEQRNRDHDLYAVCPVESGSGKRVRFRSPEHREIVLAELHERFGYALWHPVRTWLSELSKLDLKPEIAGQLAFGLARLARCDFDDVYNSFLDRWAAGVASERSTAAMVLWFMSDDDRLASLALRTAMNWGQDRGLSRAITSAVALGGPLGLRFPEESMRRLCFLALRAKRIGVVARVSLAFLFANAAEQDTTSAAEVLTMVQGELTRAIGGAVRSSRGEKVVPEPRTADPFIDDRLDEDAEPDQDDDEDRDHYERGWNNRVVRAARQMVVAVLGAPQMNNENPVTALVLRSQPANVDVLGALWADVLCSAPHRAGAIDALRRTLRALENDQSASHAVARLGAGIHDRMPEAHRRLRIPELMRAMNDDRLGRKPPKVLVSALLAAIGGTPTDSRS